MLFPFHAAMVYNDFGESFYVYSHVVKPLSAFIIATYAWFMPLLFVLAGMSSFYALKKRTPKQFLKERFFKLLVPFGFGVMLLIPVQTYFAEKFHNGYAGGYFEQYVLFFTKPTDLSGFKGGFTPGQLWFVLYLFIISCIALPIMIKYNKSSKKIDARSISITRLVPLFMIPLIMTPILDIGGKSLGQFFALFMLGFLILSCDEVIQKLEDKCLQLFAAWIVLTILKLVLYYGFKMTSGICMGIYDNFFMWISIMMFLGMGKRFFDFRNSITAYLSKASFPVYEIHQSCLVATAYYILGAVSSVPVQYVSIIVLSACMTFAVYEIFRRIPPVRFMFAIKK